VVFEHNAISEKDAHELIERNDPHPTYSADFSMPTATSGDATQHDGDDGDDMLQTYEILNMDPYQYLCSIPVLRPLPPENETATELAKAEEAREVSRAVASGWDLVVSELEDSCLYFMSGWWSYSFCKNSEIVQYHALPSSPKGKPPVRDPHSSEYVLGKVPTIPPTAEARYTRDGSELEPVPAELQEKGDQRYLVQKLEGGTICDLTGRERTIEVQYHCVPELQNDKISWIKEVTICAYVMVVNTPRLCDDVAFLPPKETRANPISCQLIADSVATEHLLLGNRQHDAEQAAGTTDIVGHGLQAGEADGQEEDQIYDEEAIVVGGITVGSRNIISRGDEEGKPPVQLAAPRSFMTMGNVADEYPTMTIAEGLSKAEGGEVKSLTREELRKLDIDPDAVKKLVDKIKSMAGDAGWRVDVKEIGTTGIRELYGFIDEEEDADTAPDGSDHNVDSESEQEAPRKPAKDKAKPKAKPKTGKDTKKKANEGNSEDRQREGQAEGDDKGSEEVFFREDL
jgi:protein OS-9